MSFYRFQKKSNFGSKFIGVSLRFYKKLSICNKN
jgi:hypothetical protein